MAAPMDEDGFQKVVRKSRKSGKQMQSKPAVNRKCFQATDYPDHVVDEKLVQRQITNAKEELLLSEFYESFQGTWKDVLLEVTQIASCHKEGDKTDVASTDSSHHRDGKHKESCHDREFDQPGESLNDGHETMVVQSIVCYGLGNFSSCVIARYQLAFLLLLADITKVPVSSCQVYDPKFTKQEQDMLTKLGFNVISHNEEGKRPVSGPTLFYMPHCGKPLYNNLLWSNWRLQLHQLIIIGNSFNSMYERFPSRQLSAIVPYILKMQPYTKEWKLKNNFRFQDIFNDLGIHAFPKHILQKVPSEMWNDNKEPIYTDADDPEIIFS